MKTRHSCFIIIFLTIISCFSCKKENVNYCINEIHGNPFPYELSQTDLNYIKSLFEKNKLSYTNYLFFDIRTDAIGRRYVFCFQFVNNLRLLNCSLNFIFDESDNYISLIGDSIGEINPDTIAKMSVNRVVEEFLSEVRKDAYNKTRIDELEIECFDLEFGYLQQYIPNDQTNKIIKAWKINPRNCTFPNAIIDDTNGETLSYKSGIGL